MEVGYNHNDQRYAGQQAPERCSLAEDLAQVRDEQLRLRPDLNATITGDVLNEMTYSRQVVKEMLRYRPPAPMVPQVVASCSAFIAHCFQMH